MNSNPADALIFFGALLVCASLVTLPVTGVTGFMVVAGVIYFGLALVNGAGRAEKRHHNKQQNNRGKHRG